jgi:tetratricopeptide (TPR) repeat protein
MPQLCLKLGDLCRIEGDYETATRALERAVREMGDAGNPHLDLLAGITLGLTYVQQGEMDRALSVIRPHARRARESRNGLWQSFALMVLGCVFLGHRIRRSEALFRASLAAGEKQVNALVRSEAKSGLSSCLARRGELRQAFALAREALDEVRRVGPFPSSASREPVALTALAMVCLHADLEAATRYAEDALRIAETGAPGHVRVRALYVRASVALASPSWLDAAPFVDAALQIDASLQPYAHRAAARHLAAQFMVRAQRFDEALALLESLIEPEPAGRIGARKDCEARLSVADLLALLGRSAAARDHAATVLRWISRFRLQGDRALVARTQALHARLGRADAA